MGEAYLEALLERSEPGAVTGVYLKGSALKPWDSAIDYVPELSDVDVHVRFATWPDGARGLASVRGAALLTRSASSAFQRRHPRASHRPRPQLLVVNELERQPRYMPSPASTVETLFGDPYPESTRAAYLQVVPNDRSNFLADADFVRDDVPWKLIDRPDRLAWRVVDVLTWRVGPAGPRLLTQLGVDPFDAWSMNRTSVARELETRAGPAVSEAYRDFYLAGWEGFRSGFGTAPPAIRALSAAEALFDLGRRLLKDRDGR